METQTTVLVLGVMTDFRQQPNTPEHNIKEHVSKTYLINMFNRSQDYRNKDYSREEQRKRDQQVGRKGNNVRGQSSCERGESDLVKLFGLKTTNYLMDNFFIEMSKLQQNKRHNGHVFISAPCHVYDELVKLHGLKFNGRKTIIKEIKTSPGPLVNELSRKAVANDQQSMHKSLQPLLTLGQDYQQHPQKNNIQFRTLTVHFLLKLYQRKKQAICKSRNGESWNGMKGMMERVELG